MKCAFNRKNILRTRAIVHSYTTTNSATKFYQIVQLVVVVIQHVILGGIHSVIQASTVHAGKLGSFVFNRTHGPSKFMSSWHHTTRRRDRRHLRRELCVRLV